MTSIEAGSRDACRKGRRDVRGRTDALDQSVSYGATVDTLPGPARTLDPVESPMSGGHVARGGVNPVVRLGH